MSYTKRISNTAWTKLYGYLVEFLRIHTANEEKTRRFVEAVFWMVRSGSQWRLLAKEYGNWNVVYQRFADWADRGVWYKILYYFTRRPGHGIYHGGFHHFTRSCLCQWCDQNKTRRPG